MASRFGRAAFGDLRQLGGGLRGKSSEAGTESTSSPMSDREAAAGVERVEAAQPRPLELQQPQADAKRRPPRIDRAELRADVQVDAAPAQRAARAAAGLDHGRQLLGQHAELRRRRTDREPVVRLRRDLRVDAHEHVLAHATRVHLGGQRGRVLGRLEADP